MPKIYTVFLTAFGRHGEVRFVKVPKDHKGVSIDDILHDVYHYGQNDTIPQPHPSVSMGDIIQVVGQADSDYYLVKAIGFHKMSMDDLVEFIIKTDRPERSFHPLVRGK